MNTGSLGSYLTGKRVEGLYYFSGHWASLVRGVYTQAHSAHKKTADEYIVKGMMKVFFSLSTPF